MINGLWRENMRALRKRPLYPVAEPLAHTRRYWYAFGIVTVAVCAFCAFFIAYLTTRYDAFQTNAEDLGIMDQAIWSVLHGQIFHQTICNTVFDTNCVSLHGFGRFAIHFEPILFPISLFYLIWSNPKMLLVVQTVIVASGAYPAFWLARLRLRSELAGIAIAVLYLLYPAQQQATVFDFHAVTLTAAFLLFMLYFMYTRRTGWMFVFAILAMGCKEEMPVIVATCGLWSVVFQHRWRSGLLLVVIGLCWSALAFFVVMPHFSPTGHPLLVSRYPELKNPVHFLLQTIQHPGAFLHTYVLDVSHAEYLHILFAPAGSIPIGGGIICICHYWHHGY